MRVAGRIAVAAVHLHGTVITLLPQCQLLLSGCQTCWTERATGATPSSPCASSQARVR